MNLSVIAVAEKLSEPEITHHADKHWQFSPVFQCFQGHLNKVYIVWQRQLFPNPSLISFCAPPPPPFFTSFCKFQKHIVMTMLIHQSSYEHITQVHTQVYTRHAYTSDKKMFLKF